MATGRSRFGVFGPAPVLQGEIAGQAQQYNLDVAGAQLLRGIRAARVRGVVLLVPGRPSMRQIRLLTSLMQDSLDQAVAVVLTGLEVNKV